MCVCVCVNCMCVRVHVFGIVDVLVKHTCNNYVTCKLWCTPRTQLSAILDIAVIKIALRDNITTCILAPLTRDISSVLVDICYIRWSKWMISLKFDGALWLSRSLVTRLGVCVQNKLNANLTALRTFYYDVPLKTITAYSDYAGHFFLGQFPQYGIAVIVVALVLIELVIFSRSVNINLFLTGCLCALNYMSKLDHLT